MAAEKQRGSWRGLAFRIATWVLAALCFWLVYGRLEAAAERDGLTVAGYLADFFAGVNWLGWLALMAPYSVFFFIVDAHATWRAVKWFNAPSLKLSQALPVRASAYILSLVNEQASKGAMSLYLLRRHEVPGWQALSTMIFFALVEIYLLLSFSAFGFLYHYDLISASAGQLTTVFTWVYAIAFLYFPVHLAFFRGRIPVLAGLRGQQIFQSLRRAEFKHYLLILLCKAPNLLGAVVVYTLALELFGVPVGFGQLLAFLPLIFLAAALPLPLHAGALLLWTLLFPHYPEVSAFSLVMHTFFVIFNALIGVLFLPRANRELFVERPL